MKKMMATLLSSLMVLSMLSACSSDTASTTTTTESTTTTTTTTEVAEETVENSDGTVPQPEGYPSKEITFIAPADAGSDADTNVRTISDHIDLGGADIVVQNISGATQTIGIASGAAAAADGYTIVSLVPAGNWIQPHLIDLTYDPDSFTCVANLFDDATQVFFVREDSEIQTAEEFIQALIDGQTFKYATPNNGSVPHIMSLDMMDQLGATGTTHVAYNGAAEAVTALLSGEVDFAIAAYGVFQENVNAGQVRAICASFDDGIVEGNVPGIAFLDEFGLEGLELYAGFTILAVPAGTPDDIVAWLRQEFETYLSESDVWLDYLDAIGRVRENIYVGDELDQANRDIFDAYGSIIDTYW
ncbi:tripartite tricarboxylate transporter substrate binding protein [Bengtsoniella intestinalis]|uniref:tripartite tricarboxylate transporter substrate binding protein n=1 Tax=Bengtsoniella intestinalis TaxID=3073143 RepID=UPI00391F2231